MENIYQVKYMTADGELKYGNPRDLAGVAEKALEGAAWKMDANNIPTELTPSWRAIEFSNYQAAAKGIQKGLKSSNDDTKAMAKKLENVAMAEFKKQANSAAAVARDGDFWPAYKMMSTVQSTFGEFDLPKKFLGMIEKLEDKPEVKSQMKASRQLRKALELARSRVKSKSAIGKRRLKELVEEHPDTEAAEKARKLLNRNS